MIKPNLNPNSKFLTVLIFIIGAVSIIGVYLLSQGDKRKYDTEPETEPEITTPTPTIKQATQSGLIKTEIPKSFKDNKNITASDNTLFSIDKENRLVFYIQGQPKAISFPGKTVINYTAKDDLVIYETGIYADIENEIYIYRVSSGETTQVETQKLKPIIAYAISPNNQHIAFLTNYHAGNATSSFTIYSVASRGITKVQSFTRANKIMWGNDDTVIFSSKTDQAEPNFYFNVFSSVKRQVVLKDLVGTEKSTKVGHGFLYYINPIGRSLSRISLTDFQDTLILEKAPINSEIIPDPYVEFIYLITQKTQSSVEISKINTAKKAITSTKIYKLNASEYFIEPLLLNGDLYLKIYNTNSKEYSIRTP